MKLITIFLIGCLTFVMAHKKATFYKSVNGQERTSVSTAINNNTNDVAIAQSVVFIAGVDEGESVFYTNARNYFEQKGITIVDNLYSLNEIIEWVNNNGKNKTFDQIHIVCHSNAWRGMSLNTTKNGTRITLKTLTQAINSAEIIAVENSVTAQTQVVFHSCGLGDNTLLLAQLKNVFTNDTSPSILASPYYTIFGGRFANHYLAKPYYVTYPTAHSPGPKALSEKIAKRYPQTAIDWQKALTIRKEEAVGSVYSYRFNIPVEWEVAYADATLIPSLGTSDEVLDFIGDQDALALHIYEMDIPVEDFRWTVKISEGIVKIYGKTTVLCVLQPLMEPDDKGNYVTMDVENTAIFNSL